MGRPTPIEEQIGANLTKLDEPPFAGNRVWLTFYLSGPPENLRLVSEALADRGWLNTDGWEAAFLYPKVRTDRTTAAIVDVAEATRELCGAHEVEILNIDADTSPNVQDSKFVTLYRSDW